LSGTINSYIEVPYAKRGRNLILLFFFFLHRSFLFKFIKTSPIEEIGNAWGSSWTFCKILGWGISSVFRSPVWLETSD
jgi:hypothetical protein